MGTDFLFGNFLFGTVKLTKNANPEKYKYSSNGIGFDTCGDFSLANGIGFGKNVIVIGADMSLSVHIDNEKKDVLILSKGLTEGLDDSMLTAGKEHPINFTEQQKKLRRKNGRNRRNIIIGCIVIYLLIVY